MANVLKTVQDLVPGREYIVRVRAKNTDLNTYSNATDSIRFTVPQDSTIPGQVQNLSLYSSFQTVMFVYDFVDDNDISYYEYELYYGSLSGGEPTGELHSQGRVYSNVFTVSVDNSTTDNATGVSDPITYSGRMRAVDITGNIGEWSVFVQSDQDTPLIDEQFIASLTAAKITAGTIGAHTITLDGINSIIQSSNYSSGVSGWQIKGDGTAEFASTSIRGDLNAVSVTVGNGDYNYWNKNNDGNFRVGDASKYLFWDSSAGTLNIRGDIIADSLYLLQEGSDSIYVGEYAFNTVSGHGILFRDSDWSDPDAIAAFQFSGNPIPSYDQSITQIVNEMQGSASSYLSLSREDYSLISIKANTADAGASAYIESTDTYSGFSLSLARDIGFAKPSQELIRAGLNVSDGTGYLSLSPVASVNHIYVGINTISPDEILHIAYNNPVIKLEDTNTSILSGQLSSGIEFYTSDTTNSGVGAFIRAVGASTNGELRLALGAGTPGSPSDSIYITRDDVQVVKNLELFPTSNDVLNFGGIATSDNRGISFNNRTALSADYNDGYLRLNNASEFSNGVYTPGVLRVGSGTAGAPGLAFATDSNTGIYRPAENELSIATAGVERLKVQSDGVVLFPTSGSTLGFKAPAGTGVSCEIVSGFGYYFLRANTSLFDTKENIQEVGDWLVPDMIDQINPLLWNRKTAPGIPEIGPMAEDMQAISPFLAACGIDADENGELIKTLQGVNNTSWFSLLTIALQNARARISDLEQAVEQLQAAG